MDWAALLQTGLRELRLSPDAFWALTPAELRLMVAPPPGARPLTRDRLTDLLAQFPDSSGPNHSGGDSDG